VSVSQWLNLDDRFILSGCLDSLVRHRLYVICGSWVVFFVVFGVLSVLPVVLSKVIALLGGLVGGFLAAPVLHVQLRLREIGE